MMRTAQKEGSFRLKYEYEIEYKKTKVALNPLTIIFFKFAESLIVTCWLFSNTKNCRSSISFLSYEHLKPK